MPTRCKISENHDCIVPKTCQNHQGFGGGFWNVKRPGFLRGRRGVPKTTVCGYLPERVLPPTHSRPQRQLLDVALSCREIGRTAEKCHDRSLALNWTLSVEPAQFRREFVQTRGVNSSGLAPLDFLAIRVNQFKRDGFQVCLKSVPFGNSIHLA